MDLYMAGAEQPIYARKLEELGVTHAAISFYEWQRRHAGDRLSKVMPASMHVCITAGVARKDEPVGGWKEFGDSYIEFCEQNADECLIYDLDAPGCPLPLRNQIRDQLARLPNLVAFPAAEDELRALTAVHERIGVNAAMAKSLGPNVLRRLPATLYGSNITDPKLLRLAKFSASTTFTWMAGRRFGELWVFARNKLVHYQADQLLSGVRSHERDITALGVDPGKCAENDREALTALAVRSLQAMAASLSKRPRDRQEVTAPLSENPESNVVPIGTELAATSPQPMGAEPLHQRERVALPVISTKVENDQRLITSTTDSLRKCSTCYLSTMCPEYRDDYVCAYGFPVEISTVAQRKAANQALLEIQYQRVTFLHLADQLDGGKPSADVGREMDRFLKMQQSMKEVDTPAGGGAAVQSFFGNMPRLGSGDGQEGDDEEDDFEDEEGIDHVGPSGESEGSYSSD